MVRDEDFFLQLWARHYGREFGRENLFIIDHNSQHIPPGDVLGPGANIWRLPYNNPVSDPTGENRAFDDERRRCLSRQADALLAYYDAVVIGDADEIWVTDAPGQSLRAYLDALPEIGMRAGMGIEMFHDPGTEPPWDPEANIFDQRRFFRYRFLCAKPWLVGERGRELLWHGARGGFQLDGNLLLVHLHSLDEAQLRARRTARQADYAAGRGGKNSRWKDPPDDAVAQVARYAAMAVEPGDMMHHDLLEELFPGHREREFSSDTYARIEGGHARRRMIAVEQFVPDALRKALLDMRFRLPDRYLGKA